MKRLERREYRHKFVNGFQDNKLSAHITAMREERDLRQEQLGEVVGMRQSQISRFEAGDYSSWTVRSLRRLAEAFDVALQIDFVSFDHALSLIKNASRSNLTPKSGYRSPRVFAGDLNYKTTIDSPIPATPDTPSPTGFSPGAFFTAEGPEHDATAAA